MSFICHIIYMDNQSDIYHVYFFFLCFFGVTYTIQVCFVIYISGEKIFLKTYI
jgi:hypothetical protein